MPPDPESRPLSDPASVFAAASLPEPVPLWEPPSAELLPLLLPELADVELVEPVLPETELPDPEVPEEELPSRLASMPPPSCPVCVASGFPPSLPTAPHWHWP
jgi:hypothetical protein